MHSTTPIPGSAEVVGIEDLVSQRLVRLAPKTGEQMFGPRTVGLTSRLAVSPGATWVYALANDPARRGANVRRYALDDLTLDETFEVPSDVLPRNEYVHAMVGVPGDEALLLVGTSRGVAVFRDGVLLPTTFPEDVRDIAPISSSEVYVAAGNGAYRLTVGAAGVESWTQVSDFPPETPLRLRGDALVAGYTAYDLPAFTERSSTEFERAAQDPFLPVRYGLSDVVTVFDGPSGEVLARTGRHCIEQDSWGIIDDLHGLLIGGGMLFDGIQVVDILLRCGAYGEFTPVPPDRVFDSRTGFGNDGVAERLLADETIRVKIHGRGGVPETGVESVVLNVTAVGQADAPSGWNYLTVWPAGYDRPTVASVNIANGATVGNMVTVSTAAGGYVDVYSNAGSVDVVVDVMGYFASAIAPNGSRFVSIPNKRITDTRQTGAPLGPGARMTVDPGGRLTPAGIAFWRRSDVTAIVLNVTAVGSTTGGHLRVFPSGDDVPAASSMNFPAFADVNRLVTVMTGPGGRVDIWNPAGFVNVVVDIVGVYVDVHPQDQRGRFVGLVPFRMFDSRESSPFPGDGKLVARDTLWYSGLFDNEDLVANLTVTQTNGPGFLSAGPLVVNPDLVTDLAATSSLNFSAANETIGNQSIINTGFEGSLGVYTSTTTHAVIDLFGYYTSPGEAQF